MEQRGDSSLVERPVLPGEGGSIPTSPLQIAVFQIKSEEAEPWCKRKHYARRVPPISYAFGLYVNKVLEGVITYGSLATPQVKNGMFDKETIEIIELNRLCLDTKLKNAASIIIGHSLRLLPGPLAVISYADGGQGHIGYIYQATNFLYTGAVTSHDSEYLVNGKKVHPRSLAAQGITAPKEWAKQNGVEIVKPKPKHRYVYFVGTKQQKKEMKKSLQYPVIAKYPKGDTKRYDVGGNVPIQGVMF